MKPWRPAAALLLVVALLPPSSVGAQTLPIFDAHIHYSRGDWDSLSPDQALAILSAANVRRAVVSSTPDDGTLKLYDRAPQVVVPFLRPYRTSDDMATWPRDPAVAAYVEDRLKRGVHRGIGELHLSAADVEAPVMRRIAELAAARRLFVQAHVDDVAVERLLTTYPGVRILWAHAGMSASAATVGRLLQRFPALWVELALRSDVAPGGTLDAGWRAVFLRHPDRFLVGTDTWVASRWHALGAGMRDIRGWLGQLPPTVAEQIAWRNGDRLFPAPP